ncbi:MAG: hypothetical protein JNL50_01960, partial [Phycisphaerae bacterium]|nr:hypothetical protein [Phycisphaerae bacterium]
LPGHETWGAMRYVDYQQFYGQRPTTEKILQDMAATAAMGYVPAYAEAIDLNSSALFNAAESWKVTLPEDLWIPADQMMAGAETSALGGPSGAERASGGRGGGDGGSAILGSRATRQTGAAGQPTGTKPAIKPITKPGVTRSGVRASPAGTVRIDRSAASGPEPSTQDPARRAAQAATERRAAAEALRRVRESFRPKVKANPIAPAKEEKAGEGVRTVTNDRKPTPPNETAKDKKKPAEEAAPAQSPKPPPSESPEEDDINPDR